MKIIIIYQGKPIRIHHDPREIIYNKEENKVEVPDSDIGVTEKFSVEKRTLDWVPVTKDSKYEEVHAIFYVKSEINVCKECKKEHQSALSICYECYSNKSKGEAIV